MKFFKILMVTFISLAIQWVQSYEYEEQKLLSGSYCCNSGSTAVSMTCGSREMMGCTCPSGFPTTCNICSSTSDPSTSTPIRIIFSTPPVEAIAPTKTEKIYSTIVPTKSHGPISSIVCAVTSAANNILGSVTGTRP